MSKFFIFFLLSFTLHLALGGILLYRSGLLGKSTQVEVETASMEEGEELSTLGDKDRDKESQLVMEEPPPPPPPPVKTPVKKKKKKASKKVKKISKKKPKKKKPVSPPPVVEEPKSAPAPKAPPVPKPVVEEPIEEAPKAEPVLEPEPVIEKPVEEEPKPEPVPKSKPESEPAATAPEPELAEEASELVREPSVPAGENENSAGESPTSQAGTTPETARVFDQLKQIPGNPLPEYPKEALEQKWEGVVEVLYYVSTGGFVEQIQIGRSSGHIVLDNAAIKALSRYRYELGQEGWVRHRVEFFLEKDKEIKEIVPLRTMDDQ